MYIALCLVIKLIEMDTTSLLKQVFAWFIPAFLKNKGATIIANDFSDAITGDILAFWEKLKPIFIKDDEETAEFVKKVEVDPNDAESLGVLKYRLKSKSFNSEEIALMERFLNEIEEKSKSSGHENSLTISDSEKIVAIAGSITNSNITTTQK